MRSSDRRWKGSCRCRCAALNVVYIICTNIGIYVLYAMYTSEFTYACVFVCLQVVCACVRVCVHMFTSIVAFFIIHEVQLCSSVFMSSLFCDMTACYIFCFLPS